MSSSNDSSSGSVVSVTNSTSPSTWLSIATELMSSTLVDCITTNVSDSEVPTRASSLSEFSVALDSWIVTCSVSELEITLSLPTLTRAPELLLLPNPIRDAFTELAFTVSVKFIVKTPAFMSSSAPDKTGGVVSGVCSLACTATVGATTALP